MSGQRPTLRLIGSMANATPAIRLNCIARGPSVAPIAPSHATRTPLNTIPRSRTIPRLRRTYYTSTAPITPPYPLMESAILSAAYTRVPTSGFTQESLTQGAIDAGYLPASTNLFPHGAFDLVEYHLVTERLALKDRVQFPGAEDQTEGSTLQSRRLGTGAKVRALLLARLRANDQVIHKLPEALGQMSLLGNIPASIAELARLVDEIWYLAGDVSVDSSWYTKRGMLAGVYASSEVFMTQDKSKDYKDTEEFVDRRLQDVMRVGRTASSITEWSAFTGLATINVLRSWGARV